VPDYPRDVNVVEMKGKESRIQETESRRGKQILTLSISLFHSGFWILNQTTKDWYTRSVTLSPSASLRINSAKGLGIRFFAALRMTMPKGRIVKCTNVMWFD
jgi:hypothetical protein